MELEYSENVRLAYLKFINLEYKWNGLDSYEKKTNGK